MGSVTLGALDGLRFRRQQPLAGFIVDFYCARWRIVIEVDGGIHRGQMEADAERERVFAAGGLTVLRFTNAEVLHSLPSVLSRIRSIARRNAVTGDRGSIPLP